MNLHDILFASKIKDPGGSSGSGSSGSGGGSHSASVSEKDVNFYDYDGTVLYSYTVDEAQTLPELPALPTQPGLICQGWNYDLETIKAHKRALNVGATYITDDGTTRIYIHLQKGRTSPMLAIGVNGMVTVDWGDGTTLDELTGTDANVVVYTSRHEYSRPGDYVIRLTVDGELKLPNSTTNLLYESSVLLHDYTDDKRNLSYSKSIRKIELGNGVKSIGDKSFCNYDNLTAITIPNGVTEILNKAFYNMFHLKCVVIPFGTISIGNYAFRECLGLETVSIPNSVTIIRQYAFDSCHALKSAIVPNSVVTFEQYVFTYCYALTKFDLTDVVAKANYVFRYCEELLSVTFVDRATSLGKGLLAGASGITHVDIPGSVESINYATFENCYGVRYYDLTEHTFIPALKGIEAFTNIAADCEIRVPAALADEWKAATNWSTYASQIVGV